MRKCISISNHTLLKTTTILLALAAGVFSSRADHFEWTYPTDYIDAPGQTDDLDDFYSWNEYTSYALSPSFSGSTFYWGGDLQAYAKVGTQYFYGAIQTGHGLFIAGSLASEITGSWVADEDGPPVDATIEYDASISGSIEVQGDVGQSIDPADGFYGDINYFIANSGAGVDYFVDTLNLGYPEAGHVSVAGGITNGLPNSAMGVGADYSSAPVVDVTQYELVHDSDAYGEWWRYTEYIEFTVNESDGYTVDADAVSANPQLNASAYADVVLNTDLTDYTRVGGEALGACDIGASISYTVTPNY